MDRQLDLGAGRLTGREQLEALDLNSTKVGNLKHVSKLHRLRTLELDDTRVTDAGLKHLRELSELEKLGLGYTKVSDAGLKHLRELEKLDFVGLIDSKVTRAGAAELRLALPRATILTGLVDG